MESVKKNSEDILDAIEQDSFGRELLNNLRENTPL